jgi:hypothetical protein
MPESPLRLISRRREFIRQEDLDTIPRGLRGIYALYFHNKRTGDFNVVYVGMAAAGNRGGMLGRVKQHRKKKKDLWTHCSLFEVWDNIRDEEIRELEGLFRQIYRGDGRANSLNKQRSFKKLKGVTVIPDPTGARALAVGRDFSTGR